jgi:large subunit ribosomal protein L9
LLKGLEKMRVLLLQDVFKLGRAGDVKKVADGYGRNYLIPQGLAMLATAGALTQADHIKKVASERRAVLNKELEAVAERINGLELFFPVKAGETGRLYGSVTTSMIADAIMEKTGVEIDRKQVDTQPVKLLGVHRAEIRLTMDLVPEIKLIVHREGEPPESVMDKEIEVEDIPVEDFVELQAELEAMDVEAAMEEDQETDQEEETAVEMVEDEPASSIEVEESSQEGASEEE